LTEEQRLSKKERAIGEGKGSLKGTFCLVTGVRTVKVQ